MTKFNNFIFNEPNADVSNQFYYYVNNKIFYNVYAAFLYAAHNCFHKHVYFHMFDKKFDEVNWHLYPEISYDDLFLTRAKQLREKHNNLGVMFGGGTDSTTILSCFLDNNIPIEFIVVLRNNIDTEVHKKIDDLFPTEDLILWIKNHWPEQSKNIKFIVSDLYPLKTHSNIFSTEEHILTEENTKRVHFIPSLFDNNVKDTIDREIKSTWKLITGHEIPTVSGNKAYFVDKSFDHVFNKNWIEFFYLTPDLPEISVKQAHDQVKFDKLYSMAKGHTPLPAYDSADPSLNFTEYYLKKRMLGCKDEVKLNLSLTDKRLMKNYRNLIINTDFSTKKSIRNFESVIKTNPFGLFFHSGYENTKEMKNWYDGIASLANDKTLINYMVKHGYLDNHNQLPHAYNGIMTKQRKMF